jgi:hypothetical protein
LSPFQAFVEIGFDYDHQCSAQRVDEVIYLDILEWVSASLGFDPSLFLQVSANYVEIIENVFYDLVDLSLVLISQFLLVGTENVVKKEHNAFPELPTVRRILKKVS